MKDTIKEYLAGQYDAYVKDLETLTNIDSGMEICRKVEAVANKFVAEKCRSSELLLNSVIMTGVPSDFSPEGSEN